MTKTFTLLFFFFSCVTFAQIHFDDEAILVDETHTATISTSLLLVDLDNDNYKDLVVTSYDDTIMWYKNVLGDFSHFQRQIISSQAIDIPSCIAHGDLNNDGLEDIIATSSSAQDKIVWFENLGNGVFSNEIIISNTINGPLTINVSDIDNDGDLDILTGGQDETVILFENLTAGNFQNPVTIYNGVYGTVKIKTADLNNDYLLDIVSSHDDGSIYWAKNLGNNTYDTRKRITGGSDNGTAIDFLDVNEDGFLDIITANSYSTDNVRYIINQNGLTFDSNNAVIIDDTIQEPYEIHVKDIDNDGIKDIVVSFWTNDNLSWYKNLGKGSFSNKLLITDNISNPKAFIIDDIDNDKSNDIISTSYDSSKVSLFKNHNSGNDFKETIINYYFGVPRDIKSADLNNNGFKDIILSCKDIIWFENHGNANYSSYKLISSSGESESFMDVNISDLDSDGDKDIIGLKYGTIEVFLNNGNATFVSNDYAYGNIDGNIILEDIDGDTHKDILVRFYDPIDRINKIAWIKNNGDLTFGDLSVFTDNTYGFIPNKYTAGDIDRDGDIDIIVSSKNYSRIYLLKNDGLGNFTNILIMESITTDPIALEDVDNDGYLDIISGGYKSGNMGIYWIKNNNGTFSSTIIPIDSNSGVTEFSFEDIDNNGYKDLVCVHNESSSEGGDEKVFYYLNDNSGFGSMMLIDNVGYLLSLDRDIILDDINNDNKFDIITSYYFVKKAGFYLNSSTLSLIDNDNSQDSNFKVFPVPFSNKLQWKSSDNKPIIKIEVYDTLGKIHFSHNSFINNEIDLSHLSKGIYFIKFITSDNINITRKIIKTNIN
ncbi:T9SS type A sorting domain-containing protein [Pseudotamlana agarivorans]|uniref:T9SS type A sorting domain-containing protein n=1 Tax=Pseudotamlana agarivorans TaxID=481183 RepID=UPI00082D0A19|nr:T9SS type A sorting domain-containing protein [Tamlana agarivorans]